MSEELEKREWVYAMSPVAYEMHCDVCKGKNITWSEYKGHLWCYDCEIDTPGFQGIFDGPIPINLCLMLGLSFDRIRISDMKILTMHLTDDGGIEYKED